MYRKIEKPVLKEDCKLVVPDSAKFSKHILPIFQSTCGIPGCHYGSNPSGKLNLELSVAYKQITNPNKGYIDTLEPVNSVLYNSLTSPGNIMPPSGKLSDCQIETILKWMAQKAKNN